MNIKVLMRSKGIEASEEKRLIRTQHNFINKNFFIRMQNRNKIQALFVKS